MSTGLDFHLQNQCDGCGNVDCLVQNQVSLDLVCRLCGLVSRLDPSEIGLCLYETNYTASAREGVTVDRAVVTTRFKYRCINHFILILQSFSGRSTYTLPPAIYTILDYERAIRTDAQLRTIDLAEIEQWMSQRALLTHTRWHLLQLYQYVHPDHRPHNYQQKFGNLVYNKTNYKILLRAFQDLLRCYEEARREYLQYASLNESYLISCIRRKSFFPAGMVFRQLLGGFFPHDWSAEQLFSFFPVLHDSRRQLALDRVMQLCCLKLKWPLISNL
jgi:hypothetical protein